MDFSIFDKKKKPLNETSQVIVVDFVNKKEVLRTQINNLMPPTPNQAQILTETIEKVTKIYLEYKEKSQAQELLITEEKPGFTA